MELVWGRSIERVGMEPPGMVFTGFIYSAIYLVTFEVYLIEV